jgi:hypothetical protein
MMSRKEHHIPHESSLASEAFADAAQDRRFSLVFLETKNILYLYKIPEWLGAIYLRRPK